MLALVSFQDPAGEAGKGGHLEDFAEGPYQIFNWGDLCGVVRRYLYIGNAWLFENVADRIRLVDVAEEREAMLLMSSYHLDE